MLFNLDFANKTILSCLFFFFFLLTYLLISAFITQIFNSIAELIIPIEITKDAKAEMETHPDIAGIAIRECSI